MGRVAWTWGCWAMLAILAGCSQNESNTIVEPGIEPILDTAQVVIVSARLASAPLVPFESTGDIWRCTWGDDDKPSSLLFVNGRLYFAGHTPWPDRTRLSIISATLGKSNWSWLR